MTMIVKKRGAWQHALDVTGRTTSALVVGYGVAYAFAACMAIVLPFSRADRVVAGTMLSFVAWCLVAVYAFATRSHWRAWWVPAMAWGVLYGIVLMFPAAGLRV
jgi:hypothetical protein